MDDVRQKMQMHQENSNAGVDKDKSMKVHIVPLYKLVVLLKI